MIGFALLVFYLRLCIVDLVCVCFTSVYNQFLYVQFCMPGFVCLLFVFSLVIVVCCVFVERWLVHYLSSSHRTVSLLLFDRTNLYIPGLYHIVFQLLGDWWMLLGLLVLAFSPMIYLAFGAYYRITRHMTDSSISRAMQSINIASSVVAVIGISAEVVHVWISRTEILLPTIS